MKAIRFLIRLLNDFVAYCEYSRLHDMPYKDYLRTPHWKALRLKVIKRDNFRCVDCGKAKGVFHVHHLTYERRGREWLEDLVTLCPTCHEKRHQ